MSDPSALNEPDQQWADAYRNLKISPCAENYAAAVAVTTAQYLRGAITRDTHRDDVSSINHLYDAEFHPDTCPQED